MTISKVVKSETRTELTFTLNHDEDEIEITMRGKNLRVFDVLKKISEAVEK